MFAAASDGILSLAGCEVWESQVRAGESSFSKKCQGKSTFRGRLAARESPKDDSGPQIRQLHPSGPAETGRHHIAHRAPGPRATTRPA